MLTIRKDDGTYKVVNVLYSEYGKEFKVILTLDRKIMGFTRMTNCKIVSSNLKVNKDISIQESNLCPDGYDIIFGSKELYAKLIIEL